LCHESGFTQPHSEVEPGHSARYRRFKHLVERHQDGLFTFACYMVRDRETAADVTQDTLMKLWYHLDEMEEERVEFWLRRVIRNACIDAIRAAGAYRSRFTSDAELSHESASRDPDPGLVTEAADTRRHIQGAVDNLGEPYRSILLLREMQECTYEEISAALSLPLNTVKVYLHRARKMTRGHLLATLSGEVHAS
jgi:RNA polymerase sigma-70 factor, ECF subfamily